ncbi:MAG: tetratricopeptide repeat protein [Verrucomicrobia bacterium]|nr:tetratricopeptide repeat protein [Verrucomicrobiota bacterium]
MRKLAQWVLTAGALTLLALADVSCSPAASKARHMEQADRYYDAGEFDKAEVEYISVLHVDSQDSHALGRLGLIYFEQGRSERALPLLLRCFELDSGNLDVRLKLGLVYLAMGKLKEAQVEADFVMERRPQDDEVPILLVEAATTPKNIEETRQRLQKAIQASGERAALLVALGNLSLRQRDVKAAETAFKRAQALDPKSSAPYSALGNLYWMENNLKEAGQAFQAAAERAPARSPKRLKYAQFKIHSGDTEGGRRLLEEMIQKAPDYLPAAALLAEIAFKEKKYDDCGGLLQKMLTRDPMNYEALLLSGRLKLVKGETAKAISEFEGMLFRYPKAAFVRYQLALAYLVDNEPGKARGVLAEAVSLNPDLAEAALLLAELKIRAGDISSTVAFLKQFIQQHPQVAQAWLLLAEAYRAQNNLDDVLGVYRKFEELFPKSPEVTLQTGLVCLQQGRKDDARKAFEKAIELSPGYLPALDQLVGLDAAEKQYAAALQRVGKEVEKNPKQAELRFLQAKIFLALQDMAQAETALRKAVELQPDFHAAYFLLAQLYVNSNQRQRAMEELFTVVAKDPKDFSSLMLIGMIYDHEKDYNAARDAYEKLLVVNPKFGPALNNLAYLYSEHLGKLDRAYELASKARELQPKDSFTADTLGWILYKRGQYSMALNLLRETADKLPTEPEVQFHLAMTHYMMGAEELARLAFQRALQLNREFSGNIEARRCLAVLAVDPKTAGAEARADLEKRMAEKPNDPVALLRLAAIYARDGSLDKAVATYEAIAKANPRNVKPLISLARLYAGRTQGEASAFEYAKAAYKLAPDDPVVAGLLGRLAYRAGDRKWALSLLRQTAARQTAEPELLYYLAEAAYSLGRVAEAEAAARAALQAGAAFTRAAEAQRFLGMIELANNPSQALAAESQVEQVLRSDPACVPALMVMAAIHEQKSDIKAAKKVYEKVLVGYPEFALAKKRLAILGAEDSGDNHKTYEMAMQTREAFPDDAELGRALGIIIYKRGDYKAAVNLLKESAGKRPDDAKAAFYLGMCQYWLKKLDESKQSLQRALTLNLPADLAAEAQRVLLLIK